MQRRKLEFLVVRDGGLDRFCRSAQWTIGYILGSIAKQKLFIYHILYIPYLDKTFEDLPERISLVQIWSDGPSSQLKNRFIAAAIPVLQDKLQKNIIWNFFATSHG